ncbi:AAA family ATPase [Segatella oris]|nr:AAA family ATPase [Segatella oris]
MAGSGAMGFIQPSNFVYLQIRSQAAKMNITMSKAILFIFSGLPAVGKSTLARFLVKEFGAVYLRIDTIEQGLKDLCRINVEGEGYRLAYRMAADNLQSGNNVVADCCNPIELTRQEWEELAVNNNCRFVNIEIICSDKVEHKKRAEQRNTEVANMKLPMWNDIENREYHEWHKSRIIIETAGKTIKQCQTELKEKVADSLHLSPQEKESLTSLDITTDKV